MAKGSGKIITEAELAAHVVRFMEDELYECYFEVEGPGGRADIIGASGPVRHVVEAKLNFNFAVVEQALAWRRYAHFVSVAVRKPRDYSAKVLANNNAMLSFLRHHGIGMIVVKGGNVKWRIQPKIFRKAWTDKIHLTEEQKTWKKPGEVGGGYYTSFGATRNRLMRYITNNPGCTMKEIMANVGHHYSSDRSACSSLHRYMMKGIIKGVRVEGGNPSKYYFDEAYQFRGIEKVKRPSGLDEYLGALKGDDNDGQSGIDGGEEGS